MYMDTSLVVDRHVARVIRLMEGAIVTASVPSSTLATLCRHPYTLDPAYSSLQPGLFSSFPPSLGMTTVG